jgi:hypothetical protein
MKKIIIITVVALMLVSCKKLTSNVPASQNIITANVAGTNYTINEQMTVSRLRLPNDSTEYFTFYGVDASTNYMEVDVWSIHNLAIGTYKQTPDSTEKINIVFQQPGGDYYLNVYTAANPSSVTITSIDSTSIQGTFAGILYDMGDSTQDSKTVTNGKFILTN